MKREMKIVLWDEMSFMGMKLVYTVSNTRESWKWSHETPIEIALNTCLFLIK